MRAGERPRRGGILRSVVEEEVERFTNAGKLNPFEPDSMRRQLVND